MTFKEQIKAIIDSVRPQFDTLGIILFANAYQCDRVWQHAQ